MNRKSFWSRGKWGRYAPILTGLCAVGVTTVSAQNYPLKVVRKLQAKELEHRSKLDQFRAQAPGLFISVEPVQPGYSTIIEQVALKRYGITESRVHIRVSYSTDVSDPEFPSRIRIIARHKDGKPAGQINGPGGVDDVLVNKPNITKWTLEADNRPGPVRLVAELLESGGNVISSSTPTTVYFSELDLKMEYGDWQPSTGRPQTWEREISPNAQWRTSPRSDLPTFVEGIPVSLTLRPPNIASTKNSWISRNTSTTKLPYINRRLPGQPLIKQYWTWSPQASRNLNFYQVIPQWSKAVVRPAIRAGGQR